MTPRLLYPDRDFDWRWALQAATVRAGLRAGHHTAPPPGFDPSAGLPPNVDDLVQDLGLLPLLEAMAGEDDLVFEVSRRLLLEGTSADPAVVAHRQAVLADCLDNPDAVLELYGVSLEAADKLKGRYLGVLARYPDWVLRESVGTLAALLGSLRRLKSAADRHAPRFHSEGWRRLFAALHRDLEDSYLGEMQHHLDALRLPHGHLWSARLGPANKPTDLLLHPPPEGPRSWLERWKAWFRRGQDAYTFELSPRDEAGVKALEALRDRALASAATAVGQAADHVRDFFSCLRAELAFYVGGLRLHTQLRRRGFPTCLPSVHPAGYNLSARGLYDPVLALATDRTVVPNDLEANGKRLVLITGPNSGGKTTFLRSVGIAWLMAQAGLFVPAQSFAVSVCDGVLTHFKREEDPRLESGKFVEELRRMRTLVDLATARSVFLCNESFSATHEREGSEIACQVLDALTEAGVRVFFVTHFFELADRFRARRSGSVLFLRAERDAQGRRTYRMVEAEPLPTSHAEDVYQRVFGTGAVSGVGARSG
ncbi:MAG: DNA mismatch repair protein MutS [Armatimonadota bacterium]|nr:DNA mismatch repair protein MutS [Armatimonadota bacterium]MDR7389264.1 DNA mismatch repair protein MutS [Armatimonadota bacterium]MDR7394269.1 DNA mismatch repair protein MutS [Armatimonadota bacterium]MDR7397584.1 DNA mismatch repair protein MutS [Armatimonadota bacterium]MDR7399146.1 DNA mismatch repair protein MutS [Armatimonadota bacterium]